MQEGRRRKWLAHYLARKDWPRAQAMAVTAVEHASVLKGKAVASGGLCARCFCDGELLEAKRVERFVQSLQA